MPYADLAAVRLHYRFDGPVGAPVVVLSNSLGADLTMWDPQMEALTRRFRVLRYDTRGHGVSSTPAGPYTRARLGGDVVALLDALALERVLFCGLSLGGMTGMWLGVHALGRISRLVLANTAARMAPPDMWNARIDKVTAGGMSAIADAVLARWFTPAFTAREPAQVLQSKATMERVDAAGYVGCCAAIRDMDQRDDVASIAAPTLVIVGTHDAATPPAEGRFLAQRIPGAHLQELDAAHLSNIEAAAAFDTALASFLN